MQFPLGIFHHQIRIRRNPLLLCNLQIPADPTEGGLFLRWKFSACPVPIKLLSGLTVDLFMDYIESY